MNLPVPTGQKPASPVTHPLLRLAVVGSAVLALIAAGAFYYAARLAHERRAADSGEVVIKVLPHACEPMSLSLPAGVTRFRIVNASDRAVEWEILDGVMVVEERENIAPGIGQPLSVDLKPGQYQITCGLLSNPRGSLTVTATAASEAASKARSPLLDMLGPLAEYRVYLNGRFNATRDAVERLQQALDADDLGQAQLAYAQARGAFAQVAATAQRFAELDNRIEPRADSFEQREQDPAFGGFHRLEYGLFQQHATQGLAPVAQRLHDDLAQLKDAVMGQSLPPEQLSGNLARNLHDLAEQRALSGSEEHYSHLDAGVFAGNLSTARKVIDLLRPQLTHRAPALLQRLDSASVALDGLLKAANQPYDQLAPGARQGIADAAGQLAAALDEVAPALGLGTP